jgi:hypothetical protein
VRENNPYGEAKPVKEFVSIANISALASSHGIKGRTVDGIDARKVAMAAADAIRSLRKWKGSGFIEALTCREPIIPGLIEAGFDILHPVSPESMDPLRINAAYWVRISLLGGIGVQSTMLSGSAEDVRRATRRLIDTWAPGGGTIVIVA